MNPYIFHITLYDLALLGTVFIGLTFAALLGFTKITNRSAGRIIGLALFVIILQLIWILGIDIGADARFPRWGWLPLQFSLALGPLIYFYVRRLTRPDYNFGRKDILHFSPLLLELSIHVLEVKESIKTGAATYHTPVFQHLNPVLQFLAFISVAVYLYRCHKLVENYYKRLNFIEGDRYRKKLRWLHRLLMGFGLLWLLWIPYTAVLYFYYPNQVNILAYVPLYLLLAVSFIRFAIVVYLRPGADLEAEAASARKPMRLSELKQRATWLKKAVKANRYYQDPELNLSALAGRLELGSHELSRIINTVLKKSFNDFINEYRVADVVQKMQDPAYDRITLLGIAFEAGFNSQSTFNRIFKQMTGKSPLEYKNNLKKEQPSYNMGSNSKVAPVILNREYTPKWASGKLNRNYMFKNYLKIAWRNLTRNKSYAAINVTGLAVGIAVCMVIFIIIQYQTSFDNFHTNKDRTYRVLTEYHHADAANVFYGKEVPFPLPLGLKTAFPQIEQLAPVYASRDDQLLIVDDNGTTVKTFKEKRGLFFTGPSFFKIFDFPLLAGSYTSLKDPNNVLLTKEIAEKYFGDWKTAIGKTIKLQMGGYIFEHGTQTLKVSGILADIPANTDFQLKLVVSFGTGFTGDYMAKSTDWDRTGADFGCYVLLGLTKKVNNYFGQSSCFLLS